MINLSKRLLTKRWSYVVKGNAWSVDVDYLPTDHWIRNRLRMVVCSEDCRRYEVTSTNEYKSFKSIV